MTLKKNQKPGTQAFLSSETQDRTFHINLQTVFALHVWEHYIAVQGGNRLILYTSDAYTSKTITSSLAQNFNSSVLTNREEFKEKKL